MDTTASPGLSRTHALRVQTPAGPATLHLEQKGRRYTVLGLEGKGTTHWALAFAAKGDDVVNLDDSSDAMQVFGRSTRVRVGDVALSASEMTARTLEELESALKKVKLVPYDPEEI